jgi:solute:Na+ symporter, SSS family
VVTGTLVSRRVHQAGDFFVAGRRLTGWQVFVTLLAANIGAGSTVGATGLGYRHGLSAWWWCGSAAIGCLLLGLVVVPRIHGVAAERGLLTVGDFLEHRYDRSVRGLVTGILWPATLLILAGQIIAMAWAFEAVAGLPKAWGCVLGGLVLLAYFSRGGLVASVGVNVLELAALLAGFGLALGFAWAGAGGWAGLHGAEGAALGGGERWGLLLSLAPSFVVSPGLVQKAFGARRAESARAAALGNALALALFAFVPALLGMAARVARPGLANPELALPVLLVEVLPAWLGGFGLAALFAAEISTADAVLFMLSTSLGKDLYKTFLNPGADDAALLRVSRRTSLAAGSLGVALAVLLPSIVEALKGFYALLTVALFAPLVVGLCTRRPGARHARVAIVSAVAAFFAAAWALSGSPAAAWGPQALALGLAFLIFGTAYLPPARAPA